MVKIVVNSMDKNGHPMSMMNLPLSLARFVAHALHRFERVLPRLRPRAGGGLRAAGRSSVKMYEYATVGSLSARIPALHETSTLQQARKTVRSHRLTGDVPVINDAGQLVAMTNAADILGCNEDDNVSVLFEQQLFRLLMRRPRLVFDFNQPLNEAFMTVFQMEDQSTPPSFAVVRNGRYCGVGSVADLVRRGAGFQIQKARHANPLTLLPGNWQVQARLSSQLAGDEPFHAMYWDLDRFKPYNDKYGYEAGDRLILLMAHLLCAEFGTAGDFVGHIGADDFVTSTVSPDWEGRVVRVLDQFDDQVRRHFSEEDLEMRGFVGRDRQGRRTFQSLTALSAGIVEARPQEYRSSHQLMLALGKARKFARRRAGSSYFLERRSTFQAGLNEAAG